MRVPRQAAAPRPLTREEITAICLANLLDNVTEQIYFKDLESRFLRVSSRQADVLGAESPEAVEGTTDVDYFSAEHARRAFEDEQRIISTGQPMINFEETQTWPDRPVDFMTASKYPLRDADGTIIGTFGLSSDITRRVLAEAASEAYSTEVTAANLELRRVGCELGILLEVSPDAMVKLDRDLRHVYVNPMAAEVIGLPIEEILGRTNRELGRPAGGLALWESTLRRVLDTGVQAEHESMHDDGTGKLYVNSRLAPIIDEDGVVSGVLVASRDMTDRRLAEDALEQLERVPTIVSVLFLDLDRFKVVNDSLGHAAGDALLKEVASRLSATVRRGDTIARLGGDEFVVLCENLASDDVIRGLAERIESALAVPFVVDGHEVSIGASIGIATTSDWNRAADEVVRDADAAMYQAKERGRGRYEFFNASVRHRAKARLAIEAALRRAMPNDEFRLVYQPVVSLRDQQVVGVEALIRWESPELGPMSPVDFIPVAEETRLIVPIDRWVLDQACRQLVPLNDERPGRPPPTVAVNISGRQLSEPGVVEAVAEVLDRHGLDPALLCLEVTETAMLQEGSAQAVFERLSALGVQIALDDLGTGYSSLGQLQRFPVNILKIDRSFVVRVHTRGDESPIVAAVTAMAKALGMRTVGKVIETEEQLAGLTRLGCDDGQGYLLARPAAPEDLRDLLGLAPA